MKSEIRHDGEYPFDEVFICDRGHSHSVWEAVAEITEAAAKALLGMTDEQTLLNKGYVVYNASGSEATAVANCNGRYVIIRTKLDSVIDRYDERSVGRPIPDKGERGIGMTLAPMLRDGPVEVETGAHCPNSHYEDNIEVHVKNSRYWRERAERHLAELQRLSADGRAS